MDYINELTPTELEKLMVEEGADLVVIDVREDEEVANGMIENAQHIALQHIVYSMDRLEKNKHYVFVCQSGNRSLMAASFLEEKGFKVSNMTGGMIEWRGKLIY